MTKFFNPNVYNGMNTGNVENVEAFNAGAFENAALGAGVGAGFGGAHMGECGCRPMGGCCRPMCGCCRPKCPTIYKQCPPIVTCSKQVIDQYHITKQPYIHNYHTEVVHHHITKNEFIPTYTCSEVHVKENDNKCCDNI